MKRYFAYIRVSTVKQGEHGSSLHEQRDAIAAFAQRHGISITEWFEERETAAKLGRLEFNRMLRLLKKGRAAGVVFHKIDRGARNLKDWSVIQDLTERGIDVQFVHEPIDMKSNEGKLTGDFLAVIASHFIRNLRDEVKKGMRGRLKQGLYPFRAPTGYLDQGGGRPKIPDPERAPFVRAAFDLYGSGRYTLLELCEELTRRGFRTNSGKEIFPNRLHDLLCNPFYAGLIAIRATGETYPGIHEPLIPMSLFQDVQRMLRGNGTAKVVTHDFVFRRLVRCRSCNRSLIGEQQKGRTYYRCQTKACPTTGFRQEAIDTAIEERFAPFTFTDHEIEDMRVMLREVIAERKGSAAELDRAGALRRENIEGRLSRLLDAFLDGTIEKPEYEAKKRALLVEQRLIEETLTERSRWSGDTGAEMLELLTSLSLSYKTGKADEKREMLKLTTSNLWVREKYIGVELLSPYQEAADLLVVRFGEPYCNRPRTRRERLKNLVEIMVDHDDREDEIKHGVKISRFGADGRIGV
ncbi:recombinase family protein [Thalassobaculum salexigens]|uniref:recombinase family protein n=1 Tax=Thalassobaculum salexigens TaxID=455360 RepID=UPI000402C32D|nr:recombinase family protein [Thalassobaculum salexigens]